MGKFEWSKLQTNWPPVEEGTEEMFTNCSKRSLIDSIDDAASVAYSSIGSTSSLAELLLSLRDGTPKSAPESPPLLAAVPDRLDTIDESELLDVDESAASAFPLTDLFRPAAKTKFRFRLYCCCCCCWISPIWLCSGRLRCRRKCAVFEGGGGRRGGGAAITVVVVDGGSNAFGCLMDQTFLGGDDDLMGPFGQLDDVDSEKAGEGEAEEEGEEIPDESAFCWKQGASSESICAQSVC